MTADTEREQRLDAILADYLDAVAAGRRPERTELLANHPDIADELAAFFADQDRFDGVMAPLRVVTGPSTASYPHAGASGTSEPLGFGSTFGDYEILDVIARGGLGVVYKARQVSLNRIVALKMMRAGRWATADDRQRFRLECEAAASLDHPNIVPIHEVGEWRTDSLGEPVPFFSMKLIEGGSLAGRGTREEKQATTAEAQRDAARLVAIVARAVDYAHERGILHRDLKPANILLSFSRETSASVARLNERVPFLTDFGLAKWAQRDEGLTPSGIAVGTPAYMAPEQAFPARSGVAPTGLTTRVDVYGLGAVLYELLTGRPPFQGTTVLDTLLEVLEKTPMRPRDLVPTLPRDLETVCLKCLEKDPQRRYASAAAVADDLDRYLRGEPISARPAGTLERTWLWARRQPVIAGLLATVIVLTFGAIAAVTWQWRRAEDNLEEARTLKSKAENLADEKEIQRRRAEEQKERAEKGRADLATEFQFANKAISDLSQRTVKAPDDATTISSFKRSILNAAVPYYEGLLKRQGRNGAVESNLALTYWHLGVLDENAHLVDEAIQRFEQARAMYAQLAESQPNKPLNRENVARSYLRLAVLREKKGDKDQAAQDYVRAAELFEPFARTNPPTAEFLRLQISAWRSHAYLHFSAKRFEQAEASFARGLALAEDLVKLEGCTAGDRRWRAEGYLDVAHSRLGAGKVESAREMYEKAVEAFRPILTPTAPVGYHINAHNALQHLARIGPGREALLPALVASDRRAGAAHLRAGEPRDALGRFVRARGAADDWLDRDPFSVEARREQARCDYDLATAYDKLDEVEKVVRALETARERQQRLVEAEPKSGGVRIELGRTLTMLGQTYAGLGRVDEARTALTDAAALYRGVGPATQVAGVLGANLLAQAELERNAGRLPAAATALTDRRKVLANQPQELYSTARAFAVLALRAGQAKARLTPEEADAKNRYSTLALDTLKDAFAQGYKDVEQARKDPAFANLRARPEFTALVK